MEVDELFSTLNNKSINKLLQSSTSQGRNSIMGRIYLILLVCFAGVVQGLEDWEMGPFVKQDEVNPVLGPKNETLFFCPMRQEWVAWEAKDVFNPAALVKDGELIMLYRAEDYEGKYMGTSRIGLARSSDGLHFERMPEPVFYPDHDGQEDFEWEGGCEDPRIVEDGNGTYFMTYTAYNGSLARLMVASTRDLVHWTKHGSVFSQVYEGYFSTIWSKSGSIVSRVVNDSLVAAKINGLYYMYYGESNVFFATSYDLIKWYPGVDQIGELIPVFGPRQGKFDSAIVEPGPPALLRDDGILFIYNGRNLGKEEGGDPEFPEANYAAGQVLLDKNRPWEVLHRLDNYFFKPEKDYEIGGQVNNVVFLEGLVFFKGKYFLYYGTADSKIAVAVYEP